MIFQQPLTDSYSYSATVEKINGFPLHRHYELEFVYCVEGEVSFVSRAERYDLKSGDIALIGSLEPHEYDASGYNEVMVAEIGPMLLKNNFVFASSIGGVTVLNKSDGKKYKTIHDELDEIYRIRKSGSQNRELFVTGCLYKAVAAAVKFFGDESKKSAPAKNGYYDIEEAL
ncbi:MAG: AraC family ligand binding domain-containing protein, partial [Clostridia bacterium]|nr:AraC family ligand binding domain-containing protein [Clostridia bacterium]